MLMAQATLRTFTSATSVSIPRSYAPALVAFLFAVAVYSPRLGQDSLANHLRLDDLVFPLYGFAAFAWRRELGEAWKLITYFLLYQIWIAVVALVVHSSGYLASDIAIGEKLLPVAKGLEFAVFFAFAFAVSRKMSHTDWRATVKWSAIVFLPNLMFVAYQLYSGEFQGYYGVGIFNEMSPTLTGAVLLFAAVWARANVSLAETSGGRVAWTFVYSVGVIFTVLTGSRAAAISMLVYVALHEALSGSKKKLIVLATVLGVALALLVVLVQDQSDLELGLLRIVSVLDVADELQQAGSRGENWAAMSEFFGRAVADAPAAGFTGLGAGATYAAFGQVMNAADSQYVLTVVSGGLLGSMLLLCFTLEAFRLARGSDPRYMIPSTLVMALLAAMATFSVTQEILVLSKTGTLFFVTLGLALGQIKTQRTNAAPRPNLSLSRG